MKIKQQKFKLNKTQLPIVLCCLAFISLLVVLLPARKTATSQVDSLLAHSLEQAKQYQKEQTVQIKQINGSEIIGNSTEILHGIVSPELSLEYTDNTRNKVPAILYVKYKEKKYINDGLIENSGYVDTIDEMLTETQEIRSLWTYIVEQVNNSPSTSILRKPNQFLLTTTSEEVIGKIYGYTTYSDMKSRVLTVTIDYKDNVIESVKIKLNIERGDVMETNLQELDNFTDLDKTPTLMDHGLDMVGDKLVFDHEYETIPKLDTYNDVPFGATSVGLVTGAGKILIGVELDEEFIAMLDNTAKVLIPSGEADGDSVKIAAIEYDDLNTMVVYYTDKTHYLLGIEYIGEFYADLFKNNLPKSAIDNLRIAPGFKYMATYVEDNSISYLGYIGGVEYIAELVFDKKDMLQSINIKPQVLFDTEKAVDELLVEEKNKP